MTDATKRRLLYLLGMIAIFLLVLFWRKPETAKQVLQNVVDPGNFIWPDADTVDVPNYQAGTFNVPNLGSYDGANNLGCGMCSQAPTSGDIIPASPQLQAKSLAAGSAPIQPIAKKVVFPVKPFNGSSMQVGWSTAYAEGPRQNVFW